MQQVTPIEQWIFIFLYGYILWTYITYFYQTIQFHRKHKPKESIYKWKYAYPLRDMVKVSNPKQMAAVVGCLILLALGIQMRGNVMVGILTAGLFFSILMLHKEYKVHAFLLPDKLVVWSVFQERKQEKEPTILLCGEASIENVLGRQPMKKGYLLNTNKGKRMIYLDPKQKQAFEEKWQKKPQ